MVWWSMIWTAGMVPNNLELRCVAELKENGVDAFVPLGKRWTKPARKKKSVLTTFKLFPGYIFLRVKPESNFQFIRLKRGTRVLLMYTFDKEGKPKVSEIKENVIVDLLRRTELNDLFDDFEKKGLRKSFVKNQLVCWQKSGNYSLGFVARSTQGKEYAHIRIAGGVEAKIPVALLSLL